MQATKMKKKPEGGSIDVHKPAQNGNARAPVQFSKLAKDKLDHVKQAENLDSYNAVIDHLYGVWKSTIPSAAGMFPGVGPFEREEEDLNRVPY